MRKISGRPLLSLALTGAVLVGLAALISLVGLVVEPPRTAARVVGGLGYTLVLAGVLTVLYRSVRRDGAQATEWPLWLVPTVGLYVVVTGVVRLLDGDVTPLGVASLALGAVAMLVGATVAVRERRHRPVT